MTLKGTKPGEQQSEASDMVPTGHIPNTAGIGLDEAGIELDGRGCGRMDERLRTTAPHVWAIGNAFSRAIQCLPGLIQKIDAVSVSRRNRC
jgi:pyruvate/2-oxoglutarate dehydrogenase complex dihydrolipoamide dehydrogenase (E3) component